MTSTTQLSPELGRSTPNPERHRTCVRPLVDNDLPQLVELYQRVFGNRAQGSPAFLKRIFFDTPWREEDLPSLTYEDENGRLIGCLGVMSRHMKFRGQAIRAAVSHHFMIDPSRRGSRAGVELARRFLRGPQDLSLAEGDESSRRIWEFLGGSVCLLYSLCWTRALRPAQWALTVLNRRGLPPAAAVPLKAMCQAVDATLQAIPQHEYRMQPTEALGDDLDAVTMLAFLSTFANGRALHPIYDLPLLTWIIEGLEAKQHLGTLHKVAVRSESGRPLGWYLYYLGASGIAEVLQVGGSEERMHEVLNHLFHHAWRRGAIAATGLIDSRFCGVLSENHCAFQRPENGWMLIHSWDEHIINAIHAGDAFLTRLEGERWISS